jgi:hypothetical protein
MPSKSSGYRIAASGIVVVARLAAVVLLYNLLPRLSLSMYGAVTEIVDVLGLVKKEVVACLSIVAPIRSKSCEAKANSVPQVPVVDAASCSAITSRKEAAIPLIR